MIFPMMTKEHIEMVNVANFITKKIVYIRTPLYFCSIYCAVGRGTAFCFLCSELADCNVVGTVDLDDVENTLFECVCAVDGYSGDGFVCNSK